MAKQIDSIHFGKYSLISPPNFIIEQQTVSHLKGEICYSIEVVLFHLPFRLLSILLFILCILFFVVLLHILVDKCSKYWSNEISDSEVVENQEENEQYSFCDFYTAVNSIVMLTLIIFILFSSQHHLLPLRISLLLKDSNSTSLCHSYIGLHA